MFLKRLLIVVSLLVAGCGGSTQVGLDLLGNPDVPTGDLTGGEPGEDTSAFETRSDTGADACAAESCQLTNQWGTCSGFTGCDPAGAATECDAPEPGPEVCNGLDDDCDGYIDEDTGCDDGDPCTVGDQCVGGLCVGTSIDCECEEDLDCAALEDGDLCNGTLVCEQGANPRRCVVDEASRVECPDPEGPDGDCLEPVCDPGTGGCDFQPRREGQACSGNDLCLVGSTCNQGVCGQGVPVNCEDGNPCTEDSCAAESGCVHLPNTLPCQDGSLCTVGDVCAAGVCQPGQMTDCQDGNPCTADSCDPLSGCSHSPTSGSCDDLNQCTTGDICGEGLCRPGQPVSCNDGNLCTDDSCLPDQGCLHQFNTNPCDDGNPSTSGDRCDQGVCSGEVVGCDDGNPCTDDLLDLLSGCTHTPNQASCDDQNACTTDSRCFQGACVPAGARDCDDDNPCTTDSCDPVLGCLNVPNTNPCDDGNLCTTLDRCLEGQCLGQALTCDDGNPCTDDGCNPGLGCFQVNNSKPCDDFNTCTDQDTCSEGVCRGNGSLDCDDGNPCTRDLCLPGGGCDHEDLEGTACSDGDPCTRNDQCSAGECMSGPVTDCDDDNPCTSDACDGQGACTHQPIQTECSDNNACTIGDHCAYGLCVPSGVDPCDDANPCTTDSCDPVTGCRHQNNSLPCNDEDACTFGDLCVQGECLGSAVACDDGNPCTTEHCDPLQGCVYLLAVGEDCDDGNPCTLGDHCLNGACVAAQTDSCSDLNPCTDDFCDPAQGCRHENNVQPCNDQNACTTSDLCSGGVCAGQVQSCDDGNPCTDDTCEVGVGCVFTANQDVCDDGNECTTDDRCGAGACRGQGSLDCDDGNPCTRDICLLSGGCEHQVLDNSPCSDLDPCTLNDYCAAGQCVSGEARACDDGNPCTEDSCGIDGACRNLAREGACDDGNECTIGDECLQGVCTPAGLLSCDDDEVCTTDSCDPDQGCLHTFNSAPCNDGDLCTLGDLCSNGTCSGQVNLVCNDGNLCTDDACDPAEGCIFTPNQVECDDSDPCTIGDVCGSGWCRGSLSLVCGDGVQCGLETCDDNNDDPCDGCAECRLHTNSCGDEYTCSYETCDDGNDLDWDGCKDCSVVEFMGNHEIIGVQRTPVLAPLPGGEFLLVFDGQGTGNDIFGRLFDDRGFPKGEDFIINTSTAYDQTLPSVAVFEDGSLVVVWVSQVQDGNGSGIFGQRLNPDLSPLGPEIMINTYTTGSQTNPVVQALSNKGFIVVWEGPYDLNATEIVAQRFRPDGVRDGAEFLVNTYSTSYQHNPDLGVFSDDSFIITWSSYGQDGSGYGVYARSYSADGVPEGEEFPVNNLTNTNQENPEVSVLGDDSFVMVWETSAGNTGVDIHARRFARDLTPFYEEVAANLVVYSTQSDPDVCGFGEDGFLVVWRSYISGEGDHIRAMVMNLDGTRASNELNISTAGSNNLLPRAAGFASGLAGVVWHDRYRPGGSDWDIFIKRIGEDFNPVYR